MFVEESILGDVMWLQMWLARSGRYSPDDVGSKSSEVQNRESNQEDDGGDQHANSFVTLTT